VSAQAKKGHNEATRSPIQIGLSALFTEPHREVLRGALTGSPHGELHKKQRPLIYGKNKICMCQLYERSIVSSAYTHVFWARRGRPIRPSTSAWLPVSSRFGLIAAWRRASP